MCIYIYIYIYIYIFTYGISHNMTLSLQQTTELLSQWHSITSHIWIYIYTHTHTYGISHNITTFITATRELPAQWHSIIPHMKHCEKLKSRNIIISLRIYLLITRNCRKTHTYTHACIQTSIPPMQQCQKFILHIVENKKIYCTFKTCCIISVLFSKEFLLFYNFIFFCSNNTHIFHKLCAEV